MNDTWAKYKYVRSGYKYSFHISLTPTIKSQPEISSTIFAPASIYSYSVKILKPDGYTYISIKPLKSFKSYLTLFGVNATLLSCTYLFSLLIPSNLILYFYSEFILI